MRNIVLLFLLTGIIACSTPITETSESNEVSSVRLELLELVPTPIIDQNTPDAQEVKFGFEGGVCRKVDGKYYLFTTENFEEPKTAAVRLALWESEEGRDFSRRSIIASTNYDWQDSTHRMSPWSPMAIYDEDAQRWRVFHVGYRRKANSTNVYNMSGRIFRYDSEVPGMAGITGPYKEGAWVDLEGEADWFEGAGKILSFYPYKIGDEWWAFYGANSVSVHVDATGQEEPSETYKFYGALAKSTGSIEDQWVRQRELNPVYMDSTFIENNVVSQISEGLYLTVYDGANKQEISYSWSRDGKHWQPEQLLHLEGAPKEIKITRTPLGLIDEGEGIYSMYFTAFDGNNPDKIEPMWHEGYGNVWLAKVKLVYK